MPNLSLGSPCSLMDGAKNALLVITSSGQVYSWYILFFQSSNPLTLSYRAVNKQTSFFTPVSLLPLLSSNASVTSATVRANGCPVLNCSNGIVYSYDPSLNTFVKLTERWWSEGSDSWQGRQRSSSQTANRGIMSVVEGSISGALDEGAAEKPRPTWWNTALTLGHLETRLHSTRLLDSPNEYRQALLIYSKKIADEGFRAKAEELIKELCGPVYWSVHF